MELSTKPPHTNLNSPLLVDFQWKKFKAHITTLTEPKTPIYNLDYSTIKKECILITSATTGLRIGSGILHIFSINPNFKLHNRKGVLKALSRFKTSYEHKSYAFAASPEDGPPATMTWSGNSDFKTWDFVCMDERQMPVAKIKASWWALKKFARIEWIGDRVISEAMRDEIVVTGLTLMYCMVIRTMSIPGLFGALAARPGPIKEGSAQDSLQDGTAMKKQQVIDGKQD
ncbi:MAG: hypothetical protein Q9168_004842 [Polycauliona sp. 1 TL-2023]